MEGAALSMAAPTEQGLSEEADLRHRFLEALCWSEASFGWTAVWFFLIGLFHGRRKGKGQGVVRAEIPKDHQKRNYPTPSLASWVGSALDPSNTEKVAGYDFKINQVVEVQKGEFELDCTVATMTMKNDDGEVCNRFTIVTNDQGCWVRNGFSGYFQKDVK